MRYIHSGCWWLRVWPVPLLRLVSGNSPAPPCSALGVSCVSAAVWEVSPFVSVVCPAVSSRARVVCTVLPLLSFAAVVVSSTTRCLSRAGQTLRP